MIVAGTMYLKVLFILVGALCTLPVQALRVQGQFSTHEFFKFLVKFGFQKTDIHYQKETYGYIFGNITSKEHFTHPITFVVLDREHFVQYYENRDIFDKETACQIMFRDLNSSAFHPKCNVNGTDLVRRVPCDKGHLCRDEDSKWNVVKQNQFTYVIHNSGQPR